uniref:Coproporphyrinogen oxidase n=1 Tax=Macrostomum lignano TaxID=282301 RepID=A0A1I8JIM4_9PLAT
LRGKAVPGASVFFASSSQAWDIGIFNHELLLLLLQTPSQRDQSQGGVYRSHPRQALLSLINAKRKECHVQPLILCPTLCKVAKTVWNARAQVPHGLYAIPNNGFEVIVEVNKVGQRESKTQAYFVDCMSYTDNVVRSKRDLPGAVFHFWTNEGNKGPLSESYPELDKEARASLAKCRGQFLPMLLGQGDFANQRIGLHFGRSNRRLRSAREPYSVVAVFDQKDLADF